MVIKKLVEARGERPQRAIAQEMNSQGFPTVQGTDVCRWETGMIPRGPKLKAYAAILGMTTDELLTVYADATLAGHGTEVPTTQETTNEDSVD